MSNEPVGPECPACHQAPMLAFAQQAFCGNDDCRVMTWNPMLTLDENLDDMQLVDLGNNPERM